MGTDIHGFIEARLPGGKWIAIKEINALRSYTWFSIVAGVRGIRYKKYPFKIRGMPSDPSDAWYQYTEGDIESGFLHNATWLYPREVAEANRLFCNERRDWLEADKMTDSALEADYQCMPLSDDKLCELITGYEYSYDKGNKHRIKWFGTLRELCGKNFVYEKCLRYCIAFDN